jgi:archaellum biogenesis ATPase FlaH
MPAPTKARRICDLTKPAGGDIVVADHGKPKIERLTTGVPTLDDILHGGFPVGSLNIITGGPGAGKSTLALQILFHQASLQKKNVYFTSILEPSVKFLRYMQQFEFFDPKVVGKTLFLSDLSGPALSEGLEKTIDILKRVIEEREPAIIAIDSFKALRSRMPDPTMAQSLLYDLTVSLAFSEATALLVGTAILSVCGLIALTALTSGPKIIRRSALLPLMTAIVVLICVSHFGSQS